MTALQEREKAFMEQMKVGSKDEVEKQLKRLQVWPAQSSLENDDFVGNVHQV